MHPAKGGLHWLAWASEFLGTALLLFGGLSAVTLVFMPGSPVAARMPSVSVRLLLTGVLFGGTGSLVAVSPFGRLSGAHINPAITFAFWITRHVHRDDLAGYVAAQLLGGLTGFGAVYLLWGSRLSAVHFGRTVPGAGVALPAALLIEAGMTAALVGLIFFFVSRPNTARWTPLGTWALVAMLVWHFAPITGTSLNPARTLGPNWAAGALKVYWVYVAGPLGGAALAAAVARLFDLRLHTARMFDDPEYASSLAHSNEMAATRPRSG
ncbi:MAG TPA: aquaporin [Candidatus Dormibacteraeota bacterium]